MTYETIGDSIKEDEVCENKYIIEENHKSIPYTYQPIDIINHWIPFRIIVQGIKIYIYNKN